MLKKTTMITRLLYYLLLIGLTIAIPYLATILCVIFTSDRYEGIHLAVIPGIIIVHMIFGLIVIKSNWSKKLLWAIIMSTINFALVFLIMRLGLVRTNFDLYHFWDLSISNLITGLIAWEAYFQINKMSKKRRHENIA